MKLIYAALREKSETQTAVRQFNIASAHHLTDIYLTLNQLNLSQELLNVLVPVYENPSLFEPDVLDALPSDELFVYLKRANLWYQQVKLREIESTIFDFLNNYPKEHPLFSTLRENFSEFRQHLAHQLSLNAGFTDNNKTSFEVEKRCLMDHEQNENDLSRITNLLMQLRVPAKWETRFRVLLSQLNVIQEYLTAHRLIESYILFGRMEEQQQATGLLKLEADYRFSGLETA
jgi:hypothetical protein